MPRVAMGPNLTPKRSQEGSGPLQWYICAYSPQIGYTLRRNVKRFRGGLVFNAHRHFITQLWARE